MATISSNGATKQKQRLDLDGRSYVKDRPTSGKKYWRYIKYLTRNCHSRLHACIITNDIIKSPIEHKCKTNGPACELRKFDEQLAHRVHLSRAYLSPNREDIDHCSDYSGTHLKEKTSSTFIFIRINGNRLLIYF
jgi:hypothetical protein